MIAVKALAAIGFSVLLVTPPASFSQVASRTLRLSILDDGSEGTRADHWAVFRARLRERGYVEGKNLVIETRYARGAAQRLPALAAELVALKPDIIVVGSIPSTRAAMQATSTIPIVFTEAGNPVEAGIAKSLARPGGNATGLTIITTELTTKWIELLREIVPGGKRFAYLTDVSSPASRQVFQRVEEDARALDVTVSMFDAHDAKQLERSFETIVRQRFAGLIVAGPALILDQRQQIVEFAARHKLPAVYPRREYVDGGGLISYGWDSAVLYQRTADYVHRIANGAKPSELPIERATTVRMVLNLKTARAQGIAIPQSIRHRADELID